MSDSHGRGLRQLLQTDLLGKDVSSVLKPNATLEIVTGGLDCEMANLGSNDHLVILGGTNNISYNRNFDVKQAVKLIANKTKHTNVILCTIPLRYDRPDLNCKIRKTNIDLVIEALKSCKSSIPLKYPPPKNYSRRGLHFNKWGKEKLCSLLVTKIHESHLN